MHSTLGLRTYRLNFRARLCYGGRQRLTGHLKVSQDKGYYYLLLRSIPKNILPYKGNVGITIVYCLRVLKQIVGYLFGGPHDKDYSILGSILGPPYFGKLSHLSSELPNGSSPYVDRIWGIWGSYFNIPKAIYSIYLRGTITALAIRVAMGILADIQNPPN